LLEPMTFTCTGLPTGTRCNPYNGQVYTSSTSVAFEVDDNQLAPNDYPFQIVGTADIVSHSVDAILRVGDFSASLDKTAATLSGGQSATFNVSLASLNHYASSITVFCEAPSAVTCTVSPVPAILTDGGNVTVQLTITNTAAAMGVRRAAWLTPGEVFLFACFVPLCLAGLRGNRRVSLALSTTVLLATMLSCGGGSTGTGGGGGGGGGGNPPPKTVTIPVTAQAANVQSDSDNQKTLPSIVITIN
jgi:hypothetical protein